MTSKQIALFMSLVFFGAIMSMSSVAVAQPADPAPAVAPAVAADVTPAELTPEEEAAKKIEDEIKKIDEDPGAAVSAMVQAFKEGRWAAAIGLLITLLVWFTRRFVWKFIPQKVLPWLTFSFAMLITVSIELIAGVVWWKTLIDGFLTCGAAMAFWSLVLKQFSGDKAPE